MLARAAGDLLHLMGDSDDRLEFTVTKEEEYRTKQLRDRNDLRGRLYIFGLHNVESKEEALEANLDAKERLADLELCWERESRRPNVKAEAQVMEGLCPPAQLQSLEIWGYHGSRYPSWMVGRAHRTAARRGWKGSSSGAVLNLDLLLNLRISCVFKCSGSVTAAGTPCLITWNTSRRSRN